MNLSLVRSDLRSSVISSVMKTRPITLSPPSGRTGAG